MNLSKTFCQQYVQQEFNNTVIKSLSDYIRIPNLSRQFDPHWNTNGKLEEAAQHIMNWIKSLAIQGLTTQIIKLKDQKGENLSPIIWTEIKGDLDFDVFYYGHYDKQPQMTGWWQGYGPTIPVLTEQGKLYGRGGGDDGYSTYSTMLSIKACQLQGIKIPRCVMITEGDQQSGDHINSYLEAFREKIGNPRLIFCLDSGTIGYETLTITSSLRGVITGILNIQIMENAIHSGDGGGVVPDTFRIARQLFQRIEDSKTGQIIQDFQVQIPKDKLKQIQELAQLKGIKVIPPFLLLNGATFMSEDPLTLILNRGWTAQLSVTGVNGFPQAKTSGNIIRPSSGFRIALRIPPTKNPFQAYQRLKQIFQQNPPYGAKITFQGQGSGGWNAPVIEPYLQEALDEAAQLYLGTKRINTAEGGSIPMMGLLQKYWPQAQYLVTGVLGPLSNAHGPNQFLHIPYTKKLTCIMAHILYKTSKHFQN